MKYIQALLLMFLCSLSLRAQEFKPPAKGMSVIYFVRMQAGALSMADFYFFDTDKLIGYFHGAKYLRYECAPGEHMFWARSENRDFITANLLKDKIYLIEAVPVLGAMKDGVQFDFLDMNDSVIRERLKKILAKEPVTLTDEKRQKKSEELKDPIAKGLAKYKEEVAAGKKMLRIEKEMFIK
ncbi:MAG: hypothetical protein JNL40_01490 [Cyclobacteriaceae bacterium]|nr:hypothetical protein [Cyclobacteriaceae bacterium]